MAKRRVQKQAVVRTIRARLGGSRGVPFPHYYADMIATRDGGHGTVQMTFYYLPILDDVFEATGPEGESAEGQLEGQAYVMAQVTIPEAAFTGWFNELAARRGLLPAPGEAGDEDGDD
jgi:hypothetical protein